MVKNEGNVEVGVSEPYPVSYRALLPKEKECVNLLVPVCLSASHIAFGSIRMEPVFMVLGQSAAVAACLAIDNNSGAHAVDVGLLNKILRENPLLDGSTPEILVDDTDTDQIERSEDWTLHKGNHYKTGSMICNQPQKDTYFRFLPKVKTTGKYRAYYYCPYIANPDSPVELTLEILSAAGASEVVFDPRESATSWKDLGVYDFVQGQPASITLKGDKSSGPLLADAVILHPEK